MDQGHPALRRGARGRRRSSHAVASAGIARMWEVYPSGGSRDLLRTIASGDVSAATDWLDKMRLEFKNPHEMLVAWIQDMLTYVAREVGEDAVLDSILETHQSIWGDRYAADQMTPLEKLALTVEGMRGGDFSGTRPRGDMVLIDEGDRYRMVIDPCGSGGVLRRGDPETGRGPYPIDGLGRTRSRICGRGKRWASIRIAPTAASRWSGCPAASVAGRCARSIMSWIRRRHAPGTSTRTKRRLAPITTHAAVSIRRPPRRSRRGFAR